MLTVEQCAKKILSLENRIQRFHSPTEEQKEYIEQMKRLKVAYAIEMAKAMERRKNGIGHDAH